MEKPRDVSFSAFKKDYKSRVDHMNSTLQQLKKDLIFLRRQDLLLLKQLIEIDETIQSLRQKTKLPRTTDLTSPDSGVGVDTTETSRQGDQTDLCAKTMLTFDERRRLPLVRQQSVPYYMHIYTCRSVDSASLASSFDDISELPLDEDVQAPSDNDSLFSLSLSYPSMPRGLLKPRSLSYDDPDLDGERFDDDHLERLLLTNIEIWKKSEIKELSESKSDD